MIPAPVVKTDKSGSFEVRLPVAKTSVERREVTGWASIVTDENGRPIVDHDGDIIPIDELEKAAKEAFVSGGRGKGGDMHKRTGVADIVESLVLTQEKRAALGLGHGPEGWVVTLKIHDDGLWSDIKSGEKLELSIRGESERIPLAEVA